MKQFVKSVLMICLSIIMMMPTMAFAADENPADWQDSNISQEEFDEMLAPYIVDRTNERTSGLITIYGIAIKKDGSNLLISGKTYGAPEVVKCGFTVIKVQRRPNTGSSWSTCYTYNDLYHDSSAYALSKTLYTASGYQYRVTCTHYAKKSLLSTEKISNTSNTIWM